MKTLTEFVVNGNTRPKLEEDWSQNVKDLMQSCWASDLSKRPEFVEIKEQLQNECFGGCAEAALNINPLDVSRKSYNAILSR